MLSSSVSITNTCHVGGWVIQVDDYVFLSFCGMHYFVVGVHNGPIMVVHKVCNDVY